MPEMNKLVERGICERRRWIIANHNLHSVYLFHKYPRLREFYSDVNWTYLDGMPLVALGRLYGYPLQREQRVTHAGLDGSADGTGCPQGLARLQSWVAAAGCGEGRCTIT